MGHVQSPNAIPSNEGPALRFSPEVSKALSIDVSDLTGVRYKVLDDLLDGIFCAYLAYYFWHWGEEGCWIVGDMNDGYVALPRCKLPRCRLNPDLPLTSRL
jgi:predicted RNase H-like nuclease